MYCVVESPKALSLPINDITHIKYMKANRDNMFICAITSNDIMIWYTTSTMLIAFYQRAVNSVSIHGENHLVEWKNDSSKIAILTTKGYLIYYKISFENEFVISELPSAQTAWNDSIFSNKSQFQTPLLGCKITHEFSIHIQNAQKSLCCFNDEIYVPLLNGKVIKVPWTDRTRADHFFLLIQRIYFQHNEESELFKIKDNIYVVEFEIVYSDDSCICMAASLSDGSAIYIINDSTNVFRGLIAKNNLNEKHLIHKCVAINPLYKLLVFGCKNGITVAYKQPIDYTYLAISHKYSTNSKDYEHANVVHLKWSPDFRVLIILYDNGMFCLFSVFGSILYDSKDLLSFQLSTIPLNIAKTLEFGIEGFSLWSYMQSSDVNLNGNLIKLKILKSSIINNSSMSNIEHISLNGDKEVYVFLNLTKMDPYKTNANNLNKNKLPPKYQYPSVKFGGNSMWQTVNVPLTYISANFPIRMSAIDADGKYLAVAGTNGFTHFSFLTRKWKIFGNEDQEREIRITGGMIWWKEFICMSCYNSIDQKDELRFYSRNSNLDNNYSKKSRTSCVILQMNIFRNLLVLFGIDCRVQIIGLEGGKDSTSKIILNKLMEIPVENFILGNPYLVVSIGLSSLIIGMECELIRKDIESNISSLKTILINVSGNLLMFQPDAESILSIPEDLKKNKPFSSLPPILLSTCVENYWTIPNNQSVKLFNHLMNLTLWLNCGCKGVKLWLPLSGEDSELKQSNRVILNLPIMFYPLSLLINEALFMGISTELTLINKNSAYCQLQKATQLFVPFIIEGLLKKKLLLDAKKIATFYRYLPYFLHILELLVHKVLEEEANLPEEENQHALKDIIIFIEQFPEYLKIISHCTRKSEVALWPYLFSIAGDSRILFEKCLHLKDLETAASYLVVLQNTEKLKMCKKHANMLLRESLKSCEWDLVKEIIRFLSAIDPVDLENEVFDYTTNNSIISNGSINNSPLLHRKSLNKSTSSITPNKSFSESKSANETNEKSNNDESSRSLSKNYSFNSPDYELTKKSIENIIYDHAYFLLTNYRLKQLFSMFTNLKYTKIENWLYQYQSCKLINDYVQAVSSIHFEFNWPYPILINEFKKTNSFVTNLNVEDIQELKLESAKSSNNTNENDLDQIDFDLIAQELANTGSQESEKQLSYLIDTFIETKCDEWVFLLALVLKRFSIVNEIMRQLISNKLPENISTSIKQGINDLNYWSQNECCGYRPIVKKISSFC